MKIQVTQENLSRALSNVGRVAGGRTSLPVLSNVLLSTDGNQLKLAATNLEIAITEHIGAKVDEEGSLTVPARLMTDFVGSLPATNITLETEEHKLHLSADGFSSTINGVPADDFPSIPEIEGKQPLRVSGSVLKQAIKQTVLAASNDEARPVLTGVFIHAHEGSLYAVATDSYRLAERLLSSDYKEEVSLLVPARTLSEIQRIIADSEEIELHYDDTQIMLKTDETELVSKLIDGKYPAYRQLIPEKTEVSFTIDTKELLNITKVAALFARESAGSITLDVDDGDGTVSIASVASQVGENTSVVKANVSGSGKVTLNSRFLIDALTIIDDDQISFSYSSNTNPCIIEPQGESKGVYKHIIMPLRS